ncbi:nicastrin isoform X2 [Homalodisca vitripennis]|uniref:nicastrin isoform X2 n=1 Tax=Homalodisca vitripennis TaxID=197043 RepID=UPI001EECC293|nr:nicastrin isoform X2 [Homalodisca vitripennis]
MLTMNKIVLLVTLYFCINSVLCQRKDIHHMMYETFKNAAMCFRTLNGTNQVGCSTSQSGSTGVVHFVNNESDVHWLLEESKAGPYMAVVPPTMFLRDVMLSLKDSPNVGGVLLAINGTGDRPAHMSPDDTCPNRFSSLGGSCDDSNPWNPVGSGFLQVDWTVPLFVVKDSLVIQQIYECFEKFNLPLERQVERSLCSLQMTGHMYAAVDTPTCLRRNSLINSFNPLRYCDPMGDQNVISHLFSRQHFSAAPNNSVVLVSAQLDAAAMFDGLAPGAMTTVTGIVTLLTTAHLLSQLLPEYKETYTKNVVFTLMNGEVQDYIGSSRVVYDMQQGKFPSADLPTRLEHLDLVIDLHQLDATRKLYCHCLQSNTAQTTVELLVRSSKSFGVNVEGSCSPDKQLPPSSLHSFLKANASIPGIIVTNHAKKYTNMFYNGLLDDAENVGYQYANGSQIPDQSIQRSLTAVAQGLALSLAQMVNSSVTWPANLSVETTVAMVDELLHCYLEERQCQLFRNISGDSVGPLDGPLPLYVGVSQSPNLVTRMTLLALAQLTGRPTNMTQAQCASPSDPSKVDYHTFYWVGGDDPDTGVCMETDITLTTAISPAFLIENYNWTSGEFSSWTESVWPEMSLRMFLKPAFNQELYTLISGVVVLFLSFSSVYWVNRHAGQLFNPLYRETKAIKTSFRLKKLYKM